MSVVNRTCAQHRTAVFVVCNDAARKRQARSACGAQAQLAASRTMQPCCLLTCMYVHASTHAAVCVASCCSSAGLDDAAVDGSLPRPQLDFDGLPATFLVMPGGVLSFDNVVLSNIAPTYAYQYTPWAPWRNAGVGYPLWPSIILSDNATVSRGSYCSFCMCAVITAAPRTCLHLSSTCSCCCVHAQLVV